ncbi:MAG: hypothetical protein WAS21_00710, partial [Geminicoccaceae bacterium]
CSKADGYATYAPGRSCGCRQAARRCAWRFRALGSGAGVMSGSAVHVRGVVPDGVSGAGSGVRVAGMPVSGDGGAEQYRLPGVVVGWGVAGSVGATGGLPG